MQGDAEAAAELEADEAVQGGADHADEVDRLVAFDAPAGEHGDERREPVHAADVLGLLSSPAGARTVVA